jgi:hypothetical protein
MSVSGCSSSLNVMAKVGVDYGEWAMQCEGVVRQSRARTVL